MFEWTPDFAYAVGLITTDGCLSKDGRHFDFTSKDLDQVETFRRILNLKVKIGLKSSGSSDKKYFHVQFGNVKLYRFLLTIGLKPRKSRTLGELKIPGRYFRDFLRGHFDGDGSSYSYWDKRWRSSFMFYIRFTSASKEHIDWLFKQIHSNLGIKGIIRSGSICFDVEFAKYASIELVKKIYYRTNIPCLKRKRLKIKQSLGIINRLAGVVKSEDTID